MFMVTHDVDEAILLSDRIALMTNSPEARLAESFAVNLPGPRTREAMIDTDEYTRLRSHIHLACFRCGEIQEFQTPLFAKLSKQAEEECSFSIKTGRLEFGGLCSKCRQKEQKEQPAAD